MANCPVCSKKIPFLGGVPFTYGDTSVQVCDECHAVSVKLIKVATDEEALNAAAYFEKNISSECPEQIKKFIEAKLVEKAEQVKAAAEAKSRREEEAKRRAEAAQAAAQRSKEASERYEQLTNDKEREETDFVYRYKIVKVPNFSDGGSNVDAIERTLGKMATEGWKLHTIYSNELGKNSHTSGYGGITSSTNATICEDVLIFEKCYRNN